MISHAAAACHGCASRESLTHNLARLAESAIGGEAWTHRRVAIFPNGRASGRGAPMNRGAAAHRPKREFAQILPNRFGDELWPSHSYILGMSSHSVAEAKNKLSELIDRVLDGEGVTITRHGKPVVRLKPVEAPPHRITNAEIDWLDKIRVPRRTGLHNAGEIVSKMRDEEDR